MNHVCSIRFALLSVAVFAGGLAVSSAYGLAASTPKIDRNKAAEIPNAFIKGLSSSPAALTLQGEAATHEWPVYLSGAESRTISSFRLTFTNAVSVSPEQSQISVVVNGTTIARTQIDASDAPKSVVTRLPVGLLQAGYNSVRVSVDQRHRVDCTVAGTYELWTALDSQLTGFLSAVKLPSAGKSLQELAEIPADAEGFNRIRLRVADRSDAAGVNLAFALGQAAILAGRYERPLVDVDPEPGTGPGLDIVAQSDDAVGSDAVVDLGADSAPNVFLTAGTTPNRYVLSVAGLNRPSIEGIIRNLSAAAVASRPRGSVDGLRALANAHGREIPGGGSLSLAELGVPDQAFDGRFFHANFRVRLPADFLSAPYGNATLILNGGYGPNLLKSSRLNIRVNGRVAIGLVLPNQNGETFNRQVLNLSVGYFRPGVNDVSIEAETVSQADLGCDAGVTRDHVRFWLSSDSEIVMPQLAQFAKAPELSATLAGGFPFSSEGAALPVHVASSDYLDAAATIMANITAGSESARPVDLRFDLPGDDERSGFVIGPLAGMPDALGTQLRGFVMDADGALSPPAPEPTSARAESAKVVLDAPEMPLTGVIFGMRLLKQSHDMLGSWLGNHGFDFSDPGEETARLRLPADGLVIAQMLRHWRDIDARLGGFRPDGKADLWTVFAGDSAPALGGSVKKLVAAGLWTGLTGQVAVFDPSNNRLLSRSAKDVIYVATTAPSLGNLRLVVGGMLSNNLMGYVALVLIGCFFLGLTTRLALKNVGSTDDGA